MLPQVHHVLNFWKKKPALGVGLGVGLLGAVALALRYRWQQAARAPLPDHISPAIFATRVAATSHGEIIYHTSGAGEPLVFLHGIYPGASSFEWSRVYPQFAVGHEVVAPDLLGFGESERPRRGLDADAHVRALADFFLTLFGGRPAHVVASGFGAALAVKLAAQHPELVQRLILYVPAEFGARPRRMAISLFVGLRIPGIDHFVYRNYFARHPFLREWILRFGYADPARLDEGVLDVLTTFAGQYGAEHAMLAFLRDWRPSDLRPQLARLRQPVTLVWPDWPDRFPAAWAESFAAALPHGRTVRVGPAGVLGALETPETLARVIDDELPRLRSLARAESA